MTARWPGPQALLPLLALLACDDPTPPTVLLYATEVVTTSADSSAGGDYLLDVSFKVTDRRDLQPVPSTPIILQVTSGSLDPQPLLTGPAGTAIVTWTIPAAERTPGSVFLMAYCAPNPGSPFCDPDLNDPDVVRVAF
jgi:hypothetical protein